MYYLNMLNNYELKQKSSTVFYFALPFTFDTETSHTPFNIIEDPEDYTEPPEVTYLKGKNIFVSDYVKKNCEWGEIRRKLLQYKIHIRESGQKIEELYQDLKTRFLFPDIINEIDQLLYLYNFLNSLPEPPEQGDKITLTENVKGWVYQWAFCFKAGKYFSDVIGGRTARDLVQLFKEISDKCDDLSQQLTIERLKEYYKGAGTRSKYNFDNPSKTALNACRTRIKAICYAHNLGYDYEYIFPFLKEFFDEGDEFFLNPHKPLIVKFGNIELRDSYIYFNDSLERITNKYRVDHPKRVGLVDYEQIHYPDELLTISDWEYQYYDVLGLQEALLKDFEIEGDDITTAVYTSTGKVRRDCKNEYLKDPENRRLFIDCYTPGYIHQLLKECFMGGYVHGNREYCGQIVNDVYHRDKRSFYPSECRNINNLYQCSQFEEIEKATLNDMINNDNTISFGIIYFKNARLKNKFDGFPFLSVDRALKGKIDKLNYISDNGRALKIDGAFTLTLTDIDLKILIDQYIFDELNVIACFKADAAPLPEWIRNFIDKFFKGKTDKKEHLKSLEKSGADEDSIYNAETDLIKDKNRLNGIFGMFVTDPAKPEIIRDENDDFTTEDPDIDSLIDKHYGYYKGRFNKSSKGFLPYSWGVWVTAYARRDIYRELKIAGAGNGPGRGLYADTDSIFYIQPDGDLNYLYDLENETCYNNAIKGGYYISSTSGKIVNYDSFDLEPHCKAFKFLHSKCYALIDDNDKLNVTVAGVAKRTLTGVKNNTPIYLYSHEELKNLDNFDNNFTFKKCGGTKAAYLKYPITKELINGHIVEYTDACIITPTTKKLKNIWVMAYQNQKKYILTKRGEY